MFHRDGTVVVDLHKPLIEMIEDQPHIVVARGECRSAVGDLAFECGVKMAKLAEHAHHQRDEHGTPPEQHELPNPSALRRSTEFTVEVGPESGGSNMHPLIEQRIDEGREC